MGIYYCVGQYTQLTTAVFEIFDCIKAAQKNAPNKDRHLFIDIDGYLQGENKYQQEMYELELDFLLKMVFQNNWVKELSTPLIKVKNPNKQNNEIPEKIEIDYI